MIKFFDKSPSKINNLKANPSYTPIRKDILSREKAEEKLNQEE